MEHSERWLAPELSEWALEVKRQKGFLSPCGDLVLPIDIGGYDAPSSQGNTIPITSYCAMCEGVKRAATLGGLERTLEVSWD